MNPPEIETLRRSKAAAEIAASIAANKAAEARIEAKHLKKVYQKALNAYLRALTDFSPPKRVREVLIANNLGLSGSLRLKRRARMDAVGKVEAELGFKADKGK